MSFLRGVLVVGVTIVMVGIAAYTSAQAQSTPTVATYDGASFYQQSADTQALFNATWGARAADEWANEHNAQLLAAGFVPPQPQVSAPAPEQTGAQVSDENDNSSDNSSDDNSSGDNSSDNDSGDNNSSNSHDNSDNS